jgi:signal recognition particle subunit SRP54
MLPGVGSMLKDVDLDDGHFKRLEAMIQSMTKRERQRPELIDLPRRRRIAAGSGNPLDAVNGLIKQFKTMQDLMKRMGKGGGMPPGLDQMLGGGGAGGLGGQRRGGGMPGFPGGGFPGGFPGGRRR